MWPGEISQCTLQTANYPFLTCLKWQTLRLCPKLYSKKQYFLWKVEWIQYSIIMIHGPWGPHAKLYFDLVSRTEDKLKLGFEH